MKNRAVVNVATGAYVSGGIRLGKALAYLEEDFLYWRDTIPFYSPQHSEIPYAFKGWALKAANATYQKKVLLWADASIVPIKPLARLWEKIERDGYWIARNGWTNYQWTADSAYPDLFPLYIRDADLRRLDPLPPGGGFVYHVGSILMSQDINKRIPHVVATAFGLDLRHPIGRGIFDEYLRLAQTNAFCGPWKNTPETPCGPADVLGHRHDQTALSVIAWRLGCELSDCPDYFAYAGSETDQTILVAKGI